MGIIRIRRRTGIFRDVDWLIRKEPESCVTPFPLIFNYEKKNKRRASASMDDRRWAERPEMLIDFFFCFIHFLSSFYFTNKKMIGFIFFLEVISLEPN